MRERQAGFNLLEAVVTVAIVGLVATAGLPSLLRWSSAQRVRLAAGEIAATLRSARAFAVRHSANVAVKFRTEETGEVSFTLYRDGDGDGVSTRDIERGVDPRVEPPRRLAHLGRQVRFGFPPGVPPRDPGDPRRRLDRLDDPVRFNRSDLASFSPLGGSTPGSVYLTDRRHHLAVVRVFGYTGKVKVMTYERETETWR